MTMNLISRGQTQQQHQHQQHQQQLTVPSASASSSNVLPHWTDTFPSASGSVAPMSTAAALVLPESLACVAPDQPQQPQSLVLNTVAPMAATAPTAIATVTSLSTSTVSTSASATTLKRKSASMLPELPNNSTKIPGRICYNNFQHGNKISSPRSPSLFNNS